MPDRRLALLVGTNEYADPGFQQLRSPAHDVEAFADVLREPAIGGFDVRPPLYDRRKDEIEEALEDFFGEAGPQDFLLLYLSCHGVLAEDGRLYFAAANTRRERLRATGISDWFVNDVMTQSRAQRSVLVLDCCHSGAFARGLVRKGDPDIAVANRFEGRGQVTLTASTKLEFAFEGEHLEHVSGKSRGSIFTAALVDGLSSGDADLNGDGQVSVDELYDYLYRRVKAETPSQTPEMRGDVRGDIIIARSPKGAQVGASPRPLPHEASPRPSQTFKSVWYRPHGTGLEDIAKMKAMTDRGSLDVSPGRLHFEGKWTSLDVTDIERISLGRSGKDFINTWVTLEYAGGQTAQFADGRNLGWSGILGGTRKLMRAIESIAMERRPQ